jgi:hypothetical protein
VVVFVFATTPSLLPTRDVAAINVTDVTLIEEFVFSAAFSTFDQVGADGPLLSSQHSTAQDVDGYINPLEMKAVLRLFLPLGEPAVKQSRAPAAIGKKYNIKTTRPMPPFPQ